MKLAREGHSTDGMAFFALEQTQGKGQMNKNWVSNSGENLLMSVVLDCKKYDLKQQFQLSMLVSVACCNLLKKYAGDELSIKWPNDLYWRDRKAGGILIENIIVGNKWDTAVIGIGININQTQFEEMQRRPVSLRQISGKEQDPVQMARELCAELNQCMIYMGTENKTELLMYYNKMLYKKEQLVSFSKSNNQFELKVKGVNKDGNLVVEGYTHPTISWGELDWID